MGLSNRERLDRFIWGSICWRRKLVATQERLASDNKSGHKIIQGWIKQLDLLQGKLVRKLVRKLDATTAYWLLGPKEGSYQSFFEDHYDLAKITGKEERPIIGRKPQYGSLEYYNELELNKFVELLTGKSNELANIIALYWEAYLHIDSILYGVYRYKDNLLGDLENDLLLLIGRFCNERYDLFCSFGYETDIDHAVNVEKIILCKFKLFHKIVCDKSQEIWNKIDEKTSNDERQAVIDDSYEKPFDINPTVKYLAQSSLGVIQKDFNRREEDKWERQHEQNTEYSKSKPKKIDPIFGPEARSCEKLMDIIDNIDNVAKEEYESARDELDTVYSTFVSGYDAIMKHRKKASKKKTKKTAKSTTQG